MKINLSFECSDLIEEIKLDILEFGKNHEAIGIIKPYNYKTPLGESRTVSILTDYLLDKEDINERTLKPGETAVTSTLGKLLEIFEKENLGEDILLN